MSRDPVTAGVLDLAEAWEKAAQERERHAPGVPDAVAANLKTNATELRARLEQIERETAYVSVAEYAHLHSSTAPTVRRLCADGLLEGAIKDANDDWRIPRNARRLAKSA